MPFKVTMNLICYSKYVGSFASAIELAWWEQIGLGLHRFPTPVIKSKCGMAFNKH